MGKLKPFLKGTGYNLDKDVHFIPVSGYTGANIKLPVDKTLAPWVTCVPFFPLLSFPLETDCRFLGGFFSGVPLLTYFDEMPILDRKNNAPVMMPISEKYGDMGTIVVGKVESGTIKKGQNLILMPNKVSGAFLSLLSRSGLAH